MRRAWTRSSRAYDNRIEIVGRSREAMRRARTLPSKSNEPPVEGSKGPPARRQQLKDRVVRRGYRASILCIRYQSFRVAQGARLHHANTLQKIRFLLARQDFENRLTVLNGGRAWHLPRRPGRFLCRQPRRRHGDPSRGRDRCNRGAVSHGPIKIVRPRANGQTLIHLDTPEIEAAEALIFDTRTSTGVSDDLQRATKVATKWSRAMAWPRR